MNYKEKKVVKAAKILNKQRLSMIFLVGLLAFQAGCNFGTEKGNYLRVINLSQNETASISIDGKNYFHDIGPGDVTELITLLNTENVLEMKFVDNSGFFGFGNGIVTYKVLINFSRPVHDGRLLVLFDHSVASFPKSSLADDEISALKAEHGFN